jgi:hypothetical protein
MTGRDLALNPVSMLSSYFSYYLSVSYVHLPMNIANFENGGMFIPSFLKSNHNFIFLFPYVQNGWIKYTKHSNILMGER